MKTESTKVIQCRFSKDDYEKLNALANTDGIPVSEEIRLALAIYGQLRLFTDEGYTLEVVHPEGERMKLVLVSVSTHKQFVIGEPRPKKAMPPVPWKTAADENTEDAGDRLELSPWLEAYRGLRPRDAGDRPEIPPGVEAYRGLRPRDAGELAVDMERG